jgi:hypothetical protein
MNLLICDDPKKPPYTYPEGFPPSIIAEYARHYRVLYKIKHGIPLPPGKKMRTYFYLELIELLPDGSYKITPKGEEFFIPQSFC